MIPKFRMWHPERKIMETVTTLEFHEDKGLDYICVGYDDFGFVPTDVILMQSTGLTDKNGVEIFEGDVIKYQCTFEVHGTDEPDFAFVEFKNTLLYANHGRAELTLDDLLLDGSAWVVIGNVYENPELVEVTE